MNIPLEAALRRYAVAHKAKDTKARDAAWVLVLRIMDRIDLTNALRYETKFYP